MKKKNIALSIIAIVVLSAAGFYVYQINKKLTDIDKKFTADQEIQKNQIQNINQLIMLDWKVYNNEQFGFNFKYPPSVSVCQEENYNNSLLFLGIRYETTCEFGKRAKDAPSIRIIIEKNNHHYNDAKEAFYNRPYFNIDKSLNEHLGYFKIDKFDAFGGEIVAKTQGTWVAYSSGYDAIILKNDYLIKISDGYYSNIIDNKQFGSKPYMDAIVSSFYFDSANHWK